MKSNTRRVIVGCGVSTVKVTVSTDATGWGIKNAAFAAGLPMMMNWQLQGHNRNGTNSVIGNKDRPWQDVFDVVTIDDND